MSRAAGMAGTPDPTGALMCLCRPRGFRIRDIGEPAEGQDQFPLARRRRTDCLPLYLAGSVRASGLLAGRPGVSLLSGRFVIVILAVGLLFACVLAVPVLTDVFLSFASAQGAKVARSAFLLGLCILLLGLAIQVEVVDIVGGALMGVVILGVILENYLAADPAAGLEW
jgi:hypothetical protein